MTEYWKSQPKKFCQYCKCWIADNKPSIEFHERGKNHKENVHAKISEIKKKSIDKAKQEESMSKEFAAMEEAALKAYQEDLKRLGVDSASSTPASTPASTAIPRQKARKKVSAAVSEGAGIWVEGVTDDGHTYYYNTATGESRWDKPDGFQERSSRETEEKSASSPWVEAFTAEGYTYYYNTITGESKWENPEDSVSPPGVAQDEGSGASVESVEPPSLEPDSESAEHSTEEGGGAEPAAQKTEEGGGAEPAAQNTEEGGGAEPAAQKTEEGGGAESAALGEAQKHKISFRWKSPAEEKSNLSEENSKSEDEEETKEETSSPDAEEESKAKRKQKSNPYGVWEQIQEEEEDPYKQVDMQLPQVESYPSGPDIPQEPKVKFKERTITSLGDETGEAVVFKKRKLENGKSRNLRQRRTDE
ncbi:WW domain-binding protein 4-like [Acipenser ruthenus]|uniref:WW domain-binding protein 4-like n=1 Tax=Acipenser ruthenus TaxID=7906 RepID=UPI00145BAD26|nr:WW domain-binding protein 4-like [Acipenser ruthenus]